MYGKPIEDEIQRIKKGNRTNKEYILTTEELADLVEKAKSGDDNARSRIWETHLLFLNKKLTKSRYVGFDRCKLDPDEALSMTYESLLKALQTYNGSSSFSFWWWRKCVMDFKSEWRRRYKENARHPLASDLFSEMDDKTYDILSEFDEESSDEWLGR